MPPGGIPAAFLEDVPDALRSLVRRFARWRGPFTAQALAERYDLEPAVAERELAALEREGMLVRGALRPGGSGREWCDVEVLRRIRRASVARLRREVEAVEQPALARFLPAWHGVGRKGRGGIDRLREVLFPLQRLPLAPEVWERQVLPLRMDYRPELLDQLCTSGEVVWLGADAGPRRDRLPRGRRPARAAARPGAAAGRSRRRGRARGARWAPGTWPSSSRRPACPRPRSSRRCGGSWPRARRRTTPGSRCAGTRRAAAPRTLAPRAGTRRLTRRRLPPRGAALGRWAPTAPLLAARDRRGRPPARARRAAARAPRRARARRARRRGRARRAGRPAPRARRAGDARRLAPRLPRRRPRRRAARAARARSSACARCASPSPDAPADRARRERPGESLRRRAALAGASRGPRLASGRRDRRAAQRRAARVPRARSAHAALAAAARGRRLGSRRRSARAAPRSRAALGSLQLERIDGEPATGTPVATAFTAAGFVAGPKRLTLRARR